MANGVPPFELPALPAFPTLFGEEEAKRLEEIEEQRKRVEEVHRGKFTPEQWAKVPAPEKLVRRLLPPWVTPVAKVLTPWEWGWEFGFTPEQAEKKRLELEEEYKELVRRERVTRVLPSVKNTLRALALTDADMVTDIGELRSIFKLDELGFTEEEAGYISSFAQRLIRATPEEIVSGEVFEMPPLTQAEVDELARTAREPRQVLTTVALSKNLEDIKAALQEMYAPQVPDDTRREAIIKEFAEGLEGATKEGTGEAFRKIAEEEGEILILTDVNTGTMVSASKRPDGTVWAEEELLGYYDVSSGRVVPISSLTGQPLLTEEAQESTLKDLWDSFYLGLHQAWYGTKQGILNLMRGLAAPKTIVEGGIEYKVGGVGFPGQEKVQQAVLESMTREFDERELQFQEWMKEHPELIPRPEYTQSPIEHPELLTDPNYWAYTIISNAPIIGAALFVGLATTFATKNPWAGALAGAAVITPVQINSVYEDLIANGADPINAIDLANQVGVAMGAVEIIPGMLVLRAVSPAFMSIFRKNLQREVTKQVVKQLSVRGILLTASKIEVAETLEEVIQESMQNAAVQTVNENRGLLENIPETAITAAIATLPLALLGGGAEYVNMKANLPPEVKQEIDKTATEMKDAGLSPEHAEAVALAKLMETETGQAAVLLAIEKADAEIPTEVPAVPEVKLPIAEVGKPYIGTIYRGTTQATPVDEGMYGKGTYYTTSRDYASQFGEVKEVTVSLEKPFVTSSSSEIEAFGNEAFIKAREAGMSYREALEARSRAIRENLEAQGYDGIVFKETPKSHQIVVFYPEKVTKPPAVEVTKPIADKTVDLETKLTAVNKDLKVFTDSLVTQEERLEKTLAPFEKVLITETINGMKETISELELHKTRLEKNLNKLRKVAVPTPPEEVPEAPPTEVVPEMDPRRMIGLPREPETREETLDRRPRIQDWEDEQEAVTAAMEANPTIANAIQMDKKVVEFRGLAERTWNEADEDARKGIRKEAGLSKSVIAKEWSDMTPPEQQALALTAIPDRSIHFPIAKEIFDIRYYMQYLQEETGLPFYEVFKRAELSHGAARIAGEKFLMRIGTDPYFADIRTDEKALIRVAEEINSRNPTLNIESPEGLTDNELMLANVIEDLYRQYQGKVRYLRVVHTTGTFDALKAEFPDAPEGELAITAELMQMGNMNDLFTYLDTLDWGVIGSGYDPWMVSYPTLTPRAIRIGTVRGAARLMRRESVEFSELKMERNVLVRLATYIKQVEAQWRIEPELSVLSDMWEQGGVKFANMGQVESALREWTRELQGIPTRNSLFDAIVRRVWRQSMGTIFVHIYMAVRNFHQHITFHPDRTELARIRELPPDIKEKSGVYYDDFVSQLKGIRRDWLYAGEKGIPVPGLGALLRLADRFSMYPQSDNIPRRYSFQAATNKARRAIEQYRKDGDVSKLLKDSGANHLRQTERNYFLRLLIQPPHDLAVPGLREVSGDEMASFYIGHEVANMTHFIYERAFRAPVEYGATGRTLYNLIVFPRGYFQRLFFQAQKLPNLRSVFSPDTNWEQARAGFKDIILLFVIGEFISNWLRLLTGRKRRSYAPLEIIQWELGGLAVGAFQDLQALLNDVWTILDLGADDEAKEAALNRIPGELTRGAQTQVPFYRYLIDSLDAIFDTRNIEVQYLRKLRAILDESYTTEELDEIDRNTWEKLRLAILGGDVPDPTVFEQVQIDLMDSYKDLGTGDKLGNIHTLKQFGGEIASKTKVLPDSMVTEEYGFPELTVFYKECEDKWRELYKLPSATRKDWRLSHIEEEAMLLFWGKFSTSVFTQGTPEWEQASSLLRTWFSYYEIDARMHSKFADWTLGGLTRTE